MAERVSTRLTAAEGRRFGTTVGGAFLVIASVAGWRGHPSVAVSLATLGGVLIIGGLVVPTAMGPVERAWMAIARLVSKVTTPLVMGIMYLVVLSTVGVLRRRLARNPMVHEETNSGFWKSRPQGARRSKDMKRQF